MSRAFGPHHRSQRGYPAIGLPAHESRAGAAVGALLALVCAAGCPGSVPDPSPLGGQAAGSGDARTGDPGLSFADLSSPQSAPAPDLGGPNAGADSGSPDAGAKASSSLPPSWKHPCSSGWRRLDKSCYYVDASGKRTYDEARRACAGRGAEVVEIDTPAEDAFVYRLLPPSSSAAWIGLRRVGTSGRFAWARGPATYRNWDAGEPNNQKGIENCVVLWGPALRHPSRRAHWNDVPCAAVPRSVVICERATTLY